MRAPSVDGLLLWTRSVHGIGLDRPLALVRMDRNGRVAGTGALPPGRVRWFRSAGWVMELATPATLPAPGTVLVARPMLAGCPAG